MICSIVWIAGCTTANRQQALIKKNWGRSFETAKHTQIIVGEKDKDHKQVRGLDGESAVKSIKNYTGEDDSDGSYTSPELNINLNTGK